MRSNEVTAQMKENEQLHKLYNELKEKLNYEKKKHH